MKRLAYALPLLALAACQPDAAHPVVADAAAQDTGAAPSTASLPSNDELLAQGEYLVKIAGCNDCHTPGYMQAAGEVPKDQWLIGNTLGFHGPWGTTFAANLRIKAAEMDEAGWLMRSCCDLPMKPSGGALRTALESSPFRPSCRF